MNENAEIDIELKCELDELETAINPFTATITQQHDAEERDVKVVVADEVEEDPLQELQPDTTETSQFLYEFSVNDLHEGDDSSGDESCLPDKKRASAGAPRKKKARLELLSRNGYAWSTKPLSANDEFLLPHHEVKGKGPAQLVKNPLETWHLLMDEPIICQLVQQLNQVMKTPYKRKSPHERFTDPIEFRSWLGLNYLLGMLRNAAAAQQPPLEELWTVELGNVVFRATMSLKRFQFIAHSLALMGDKHRDTLTAVWEKFLINCRSYYAPSDFCCVDEHADLSARTGSAHHKEEAVAEGNAHRRASKGFRLLTLSDARTLYVCNALLVTKQAAPAASVFRLVCDIKGTQRCLALQESFVSLALARRLQGSTLSMVGLLDRRAPELPESVECAGHTKLYADQVTLQQLPADKHGNEGAFLLASQLPCHFSARRLQRLTARSRRRLRSATAAYSTANATPADTHCWTLDLLHTMLDFAALNAWVLLRLSSAGDGGLTQRDCQRQLGLYLTQRQLKRRLQNKSSTLPLAQKLQLCEMLGESPEALLAEATAQARRATTVCTMPGDRLQVPANVQLVSRTLAKRTNCRKCSSSKSLKTRLRCQECGRALCYRHLIQRCDDCTAVQLPAGGSGDERD